jgi:hypothetical protein
VEDDIASISNEEPAKAKCLDRQPLMSSSKQDGYSPSFPALFSREDSRLLAMGGTTVERRTFSRSSMW